MALFIANLQLGIQLSGLILGGLNWLGVVLTTLVLLAIPLVEPKVMHWLANRYQDKPFGKWFGNSWVIVAAGLGLALILMFILVLGSSVNLLQPKVFAGWTSDNKQFAYGRHVGTISTTSEGAEQVCGQVYIIGDIKNVSDDPLTVQYVGSLNVWSSQPSASFGVNQQLTGIYGNGAYLLHGQSVSVTIRADQTSSECEHATVADVRRLREGRLNASGNLLVTQGTRVTSAQFQFEDLPIFRGD